MGMLRYKGFVVSLQSENNYKDYDDEKVFTDDIPVGCSAFCNGECSRRREFLHLPVFRTVEHGRCCQT